MEFSDEESIKKHFQDNGCKVTHYPSEHLMAIEYGGEIYPLKLEGEDFEIMLEDIDNILKEIKGNE